MCATVCPSQALYFGPAEEIARMRRERPINRFQFGEELVSTKVHMMTAPGDDPLDFDILSFMPGSSGNKTEMTELSIWKESYV